MWQHAEVWVPDSVDTPLYLEKSLARYEKHLWEVWVVGGEFSGTHSDDIADVKTLASEGEFTCDYFILPGIIHAGCIKSQTIYKLLAQEGKSWGYLVTVAFKL